MALPLIRALAPTMLLLVSAALPVEVEAAPGRWARFARSARRTLKKVSSRFRRAVKRGRGSVSVRRLGKGRRMYRHRFRVDRRTRSWRSSVPATHAARRDTYYARSKGERHSREKLRLRVHGHVEDCRYLQARIRSLRRGVKDPQRRQILDEAMKHARRADHLFAEVLDGKDALIMREAHHARRLASLLIEYAQTASLESAPAGKTLQKAYRAGAAYYRAKSYRVAHANAGLSWQLQQQAGWLQGQSTAASGIGGLVAVGGVSSAGGGYAPAPGSPSAAPTLLASVEWQPLGQPSSSSPPHGRQRRRLTLSGLGSRVRRAAADARGWSRQRKRRRGRAVDRWFTTKGAARRLRRLGDLLEKRVAAPLRGFSSRLRGRSRLPRAEIEDLRQLESELSELDQP